MRRLLVLAVLAGLAVSSCGATLRLHATAPGWLNDGGTCATPILIPAPTGSSCVVHFAWTGPAAGQDSVATVAGAAVSLNVTAPAGTYSVRAWASSPWGVGCDTSATFTVGAAPWKVGLP